METSLDKLEKEVQIYLHPKPKALSYCKKIAKIGPVYPEIRLDTPMLAVSHQKFTNDRCQLWSY